MFMGIIIIPHAVFIHSEVIAIIATQKNYVKDYEQFPLDNNRLLFKFS